jgi:hypothetical protein
VQRPVLGLFAYQRGHQFEDLAGLVVAGAPAGGARRPHASLLDVVEEVAEAAAHRLEAQAVVGRLAGRQLGGPLPFDAAQVAVHDDDAVAYRLGVGSFDDVVEHRLAVLAGAAVDQDDVVVAQGGGTVAAASADVETQLAGFRHRSARQGGQAPAGDPGCHRGVTALPSPLVFWVLVPSRM